jgi:hypothetical protein
MTNPTTPSSAKIDKTIRELAGKPAVHLVVDRMADDLREHEIPFEVDSLTVDENGYLIADVRLGIVVAVPICLIDQDVSEVQPEEAEIFRTNVAKTLNPED